MDINGPRLAATSAVVSTRGYIRGGLGIRVYRVCMRINVYTSVSQQLARSRAQSVADKLISLDMAR